MPKKLDQRNIKGKSQRGCKDREGFITLCKIVKPLGILSSTGQNIKRLREPREIFVCRGRGLKTSLDSTMLCRPSGITAFKIDMVLHCMQKMHVHVHSVSSLYFSMST